MYNFRNSYFILFLYILIFLIFVSFIFFEFNVLVFRIRNVLYLSKCLRQSSARGRREGFTRMGVPTQGCEIRDTRYGEVVRGNETLDTRYLAIVVIVDPLILGRFLVDPCGTTKREPKGAKREPKRAKREPKES